MSAENHTSPAESVRRLFEAEALLRAALKELQPAVGETLRWRILAFLDGESGVNPLRHKGSPVDDHEIEATDG